MQNRNFMHTCNQVTFANIYSQENPLLQAPRAYLDQYIGIVKEHITGVIPDWSTISKKSAPGLRGVKAISMDHPSINGRRSDSFPNHAQN
jgi:hypothetical protein